jgi:hypothetical protein
MNHLATARVEPGPTPLPPNPEIVFAEPGSGGTPPIRPTELNSSIFFTEPGTPPIGPGPPGCIEPEPQPIPPPCLH